MEKVRVSVIVPVRNEERYIAACLQSLLQQTYPQDAYEILVVDGRSSDRTKQIVDEFGQRYGNIRSLDNPAAIVPVAMNIGIRDAQGEIIIRADGHNIYPADYIENCVKYLERTGAANVGGPWVTVPADDSFGARLVAAVLTSPFGVGNSQFRIGAKEGFVETVPFGAFRREIFDRVGMYNEKLVRNQDNELNARIRCAGGKIYQTPALTTEYHPVASFPQLLRQTFKTSQWHVFSMRENVGSMRARHLAPAIFVAVVIALSAALFLYRLALEGLVAILTMYLVTGLSLAVRKSRHYGAMLVLILPFACFFFHMSYGLGTLVGLKYLVKPPSREPIRAGRPVIPADFQ